MNELEMIRRMWQHAAWADRQLVAPIRSSADTVPDALREYAHILGAEETWLARIEQRDPRLLVWPPVAVEALQSQCEQNASRYDAMLAGLRDDDLARSVTYVNSAGQQFTNTVGDILVHVALHGQYHRGKVNLLLRQGGAAPAPTDFIAFRRGVPAATEATSRGGSNR